MVQALEIRWGQRPKESLVKIAHACVNPHVNIPFWFYKTSMRPNQHVELWQIYCLMIQIIQLILYKRNELIAAGFFSFNTKSIISRHRRLLFQHLPWWWVYKDVRWYFLHTVFVGNWACTCNLYQALFWPSPPPNFESLGTRLAQPCKY